MTADRRDRGDAERPGTREPRREEETPRERSGAEGREERSRPLAEEIAALEAFLAELEDADDPDDDT